MADETVSASKMGAVGRAPIAIIAAIAEGYIQVADGEYTAKITVTGDYLVVSVVDADYQPNNSVDAVYK